MLKAENSSLPGRGNIHVALTTQKQSLTACGIIFYTNPTWGKLWRILLVNNLKIVMRVNNIRWIVTIIILVLFLSAILIIKDMTDFFQENMIIILVLIFLFIIAFLRTIKSLIHAQRECAAIEVSWRINEWHKKKYVNAIENIPRSEFRTALSNLLPLMTREPVDQQEINSYVEEETNRRSSFIVEILAVLSLLLGLMGTYLGVFRILSAFLTSDQIEGTLIASTNLLAGLDRAFGSAIAGLFTSVILTIFVAVGRSCDTQVSAAVRRFMIGKLIPATIQQKKDYVTEAVERALLSALPAVVEKVSDKLIELSNSLTISASTIETSAGEFSNSAKILEKAASANQLTTIAAAENISISIRSIDSLQKRIDSLENVANVLVSQSDQSFKDVQKELLQIKSQVTKLQQDYSEYLKNQGNHDVIFSEVNRLSISVERLALSLSQKQIDGLDISRVDEANIVLPKDNLTIDVRPRRLLDKLLSLFTRK